MDTFELLHRLSVALAIGLLIGIERGWQQRDEPEGGRTAGLRTHALSGLLGGAWGAIAVTQRTAEGGASGGSIAALAVVFAVLTLVVAFYRYRETVHERTFGVTTVVAVMLAFSLGALAVLGDMAAAGAAAVAATGLLAMKSALHGWLARLTWPELRSGLVLLAMTFVILPALPDRAIDPWGLFNPYTVWLMTVVLAAISFAGYVAIRVAGERSGIALTGIAGGLASSTATTVLMSKLAKENPEQRDALMGGAALSSATMLARVLTVVSVINLPLVGQLALPLGLACAALGAAGWWLLDRGRDPAIAGVIEGEGLKLSNPFELQSVLKFAALLALISALGTVVTAYGGSAGAYVLAALSGIADVDAITVSMARDGAGALGAGVAANAILIAVGVNTIAKAFIGTTAGGPEVAGRLALSAAAALAGGVLGMLISMLVLG
ncbi:MAG: DUF4010 domain-containing protein [Hyphomicrobium sp.]|nr:DUF4010 domain-containing protein [Hyphomicrobium sp.]